MRILLVDNKSAHLTKLLSLIEEKLDARDVLLLDPREVTKESLTRIDLVIISGGWGRSIVKNPKTFHNLIELLTAQKIPTIGICLGAEAIAASYGANLEEMPIRRVGNIRLYMNKPIAGFEDESFMVYEFHKWKITRLPKTIEVYAASKDGPEIFKHRSLPMWGVQFHPEVKRLNNKGHIVFEAILQQLNIDQKQAKALMLS